MFTAHHRDRVSVLRYLATARRLLPELEHPFRLERVRCPVLLIWGTRDRMVSHNGAERILEALPATEVELLEGVGHCPQPPTAWSSSWPASRAAVTPTLPRCRTRRSWG
jgi:pimeloyl-ACP methyl ester carboxylesterase